MSALEVRRLGPERVDDFIGYFDRDAFTDNPWWAGCYCFHYDNPNDYEIPDPQTSPFRAFRDGNRSAKRALIRSGRAHGFLAYRDGKVVGWLNAQPKEAYANPRGFAAPFAEAPESTGMLMCFVVAPDERGHGVGTALLAAAIDTFRADGLRHVQGFARKPDAPQEEWESFATSNYHGTHSMYVENGFAEVGTVGNYAVMRRSL